MPTPKLSDFRPIALRARDYTGLCLATLVAVMQDPTASAAARVTAAATVLDRAWGRPTEKIASLNLNPLAGLSDDELGEMIAVLKAAANGQVVELKAEPAVPEKVAQR